MRKIPDSVKKRTLIASEIIKLFETHNVRLGQVPGIFCEVNKIIDSTHHVSFFDQEPACSE